MFQSIFCCNRNKVDPKDDVPVNAGKDLVFIYVSTNLISKCLLGSLIQALEKKSMKTIKIEMKAGDPSKFQKSVLFKSSAKHEKFSSLGVYSLWTGENVYQRASEVIHRFGNMHSISKSGRTELIPIFLVDIMYTHSAAETKKEMELWFEKDPISAKSAETSPIVAPVAEAVQTEAPEAHEERQETEEAIPAQSVPTYEDAVTAEAEVPAEEQK